MLWGILRKGKVQQQDRRRTKLVEEAFHEEVQEPAIVPDYSRELEIIDWRYQLPRHKTLKWERRDIAKVDLIVVHHSATPKDKSSFRAIANYATTPSDDNHLSREGAPGIPYHYGIDEQVGVYQFNDLNDVTWGAKGFNTRSVHICCLGDFSTKGTHVGRDEVPASYTSFYLPDLLRFLKKKFPNAKITTHKELGKWNCPGDTLVEFVKAFQQ